MIDLIGAAALFVVGCLMLTLALGIFHDIRFMEAKVRLILEREEESKKKGNK